MVDGLFEVYWYGEQCEMQIIQKKNQNWGSGAQNPVFPLFSQFWMKNMYSGKIILSQWLRACLKHIGMANNVKCKFFKKFKNGGLWGPTPHFVPFPKFRMKNTYFGKTFLKIML